MKSTFKVYFYLKKGDLLTGGYAPIMGRCFQTVRHSIEDYSYADLRIGTDGFSVLRPARLSAAATIWYCVRKDIPPPRLSALIWILVVTASPLEEVNVIGPTSLPAS